MSVNIQDSLLWRIITKLSKNQPLECSDEELKTFVTDELGLSIEKMNEEVKNNLSAVLLAYVNSWPGWEIFKGRQVLEGYCKQLRTYLRFKFEKPRSKAFYDALGKLVNVPGKNGALPASVGTTDFAPFNIQIKCPPSIMNSLVFTAVGDDVILKQHTDAPWKVLSTEQLLNWPNVEVTFRTDDICFIRRQASDYVRYLNVMTNDTTRSQDSYIEHVEILRGHAQKRLCFSYQFLNDYCTEYIEALESTKAIARGKMDEIGDILKQFLDDVTHINVNRSLATNTIISFRLCKVPFIRLKKLLNYNMNIEEGRANVSYCELITPKIELLLLYFRAEQVGDKIKFQYTDRIRNAGRSVDLNKILPLITYRCTFCKLEFTTHNSKKNIQEHLTTAHTMEQRVRCTRCRSQLDVLQLSKSRWKHKCVPPPE